jgi:hypothetical protein
MVRSVAAGAVVLAVGALAAHAQQADAHAAIKQTAECMYQVLKTVPGVSEPKLGYITSGDWNLPFLEYHSAEANSWGQAMYFDAIPTNDGKVSFEAVTSGRVLHGFSDADIHVTRAVMQAWKLQCKVDANVVFP